MNDNIREPVYPISIVSKLIKVCQATLRIWEKKGLLKPTRIGKDRFYSPFDLKRLELIKKLIQKNGLNINGVKSILHATHCWEIKKCHIKEREVCAVYLKYK